MWCNFFILFILFNTLFASPPGSRNVASDKSHQKNWNSRDDKKNQPSTSSSHFSKYNYGSEPQSIPLDLSVKKRQPDRYAPSTSGSKKESFCCSECGKSYTTLQTLKRHVDCVHKGKTFDCTKCGRKYTRKEDLNYHLTTKHQENKKIYTCDRCSYQTEFEGFFLNHKTRYNHH